MWRGDRDAHAVGPQDAALGGNHETQVGALGVGLENIPGPGHGQPDVPLLEWLDVILLVVVADDTGVPLPAQELRGLLPVRRRRGLRCDPHPHQGEVRQVPSVPEHPDPAREGRVEQVTEAVDLPAGTVGVVGDPRDPRLPGDREPVVRVVGGIHHALVRVGEKGRQPARVQRRQVVAPDKVGEHLPIGDDHQVVAGRAARLQQRSDPRVERLVVLDDLAVGDRDAGCAGEDVERRMAVGLARGGVDVQRPVREVEMTGRCPAGPVLGDAACRQRTRFRGQRWRCGVLLAACRQQGATAGQRAGQAQAGQAEELPPPDPAPARYRPSVCPPACGRPWHGQAAQQGGMAGITAAPVRRVGGGASGARRHLDLSKNRRKVATPLLIADYDRCLSRLYSTACPNDYF